MERKLARPSLKDDHTPQLDLQMAERKELTIEAFRHELGEKFTQWNGKFKIEKFEALLNKYNFDTDEIDRESLRIELKALGFFEGGSKGKICISSFQASFIPK
jgi:hypothetical protein